LTLIRTAVRPSQQTRAAMAQMPAQGDPGEMQQDDGMNGNKTNRESMMVALQRVYLAMSAIFLFMLLDGLFDLGE